MKYSKQIILFACLMVTLSCFPSGTYGKREGKLDAYSDIFLGWIDMHPEHWALHEYNSQDAWSTVINRLNNAFQASCSVNYLTDRKVTGAAFNEDENFVGKDLFIKFSDVRIDYNNYDLYLTIDFIDLKTKKVLFTIPKTSYYARAWGFERSLRAALEEVNKKIKRVFRSLR